MNVNPARNRGAWPPRSNLYGNERGRVPFLIRMNGRYSEFFFFFISFLPGNEYVLADGMKKIFENKLDRNIDEDEIER